MSDAKVTALASTLVARAKGLTDLYNTISSRLTGARAQELDNLADLIGPAALQEHLGDHGDGAGMDGSAFKVLNLYYNQLCAIDAQLRQVNSYFSNTHLLSPSQLTATVLVPCHSVYETAITADNIANFIWIGGLNGLVNSADANGNPQPISWDSTKFGTEAFTPTVYGLAIPAQQLIPAPNPTGHGPTTWVPIAACSGELATSISWVLNGTSPSAHDGVYVSLGRPDYSEDYLGLKRLAGVYSFVGKNGTAGETAIPIGASMSYPITIQWSLTGATLTDNAGHTFHLASDRVPSATAAFHQHYLLGSGIYQSAIQYV